MFFLLSVLLAFIFATPILGGPAYSFSVFLIGPAIIFTVFIRRSCYVEDTSYSKNFLKSLPISKKKIVQGKFILSYLTFIPGLSVVFFSHLIYKTFFQMSLQINVGFALIILSALIINYGLYLFLYFKYDCSVADYSRYLIAFFYFMVFRFRDFFGGVQEIDVYLGVVAVIAAVIINYIFMILSVKAFGKNTSAGHSLNSGINIRRFFGIR
jgi:hypothetical protein